MDNTVISYYNKHWSESPRRVAEIGVGGQKKYIHVDSLIQKGVPALLVEPHPKSCNLLREIYKNSNHVETHEVALSDHCGIATLYDANMSSYLEGTVSPFSIQIGTQPKEHHRVACTTFDTIDPGDIDIMFIDVEGAEYFVLKHMVSRPKIIQIEVGKTQETSLITKFTNSRIIEIRRWFDENGYQFAFAADENDLVYILNN